MSKAHPAEEEPLAYWSPRAAAALRSVARSETLKAYVGDRPELYETLLRVARRYIAGESLADCLAVARDFHRRGVACTIDAMGESTRDRGTVAAATREFAEVLRSIGGKLLRPSISLDLSHIGLAIDADLAARNLTSLAELAAATDSELMVSMEGSERTDAILNIYEQVGHRFACVGITLQAYLHRTPTDLARVLELPGRVRLVKGAFAEPVDRALPRGAELDSRFLRLLATALERGARCSIATHDPTLVRSARELLASSPGAHLAEFEMLLGVQEPLLETLRADGYPVRVYLSYGKEWLLYVCHRLAENPLSILRAVVDAVGLNVEGAS